MAHVLAKDRRVHRIWFDGDNGRLGKGLSEPERCGADICPRVHNDRRSPFGKDLAVSAKDTRVDLRMIRNIVVAALENLPERRNVAAVAVARVYRTNARYRHHCHANAIPAVKMAQKEP